MDRLTFEGLFRTNSGRSLYGKILTTVRAYGMDRELEKGILLGFSGGADSLCLLLFLLKYREENGEFPLVACHVHHGIRGTEADRDEAFCREVCQTLGVQYILRQVDCPVLAKQSHRSLEETARIARYNEFRNIIEGRKDVPVIATAHNSTDNLETVIQRMMRGSGSKGLGGISPVDKRLVRPLLEVTSDEIRNVLSDAGIPFVFDSTNSDTNITRNYVRSEILPTLRVLNPQPEDAVNKLCRNLREDDAALSHIAERFLENYNEDKIPVSDLSATDEAIFSRIVFSFEKRFSPVSLEETHIREIYRKILENAPFSVSVPGNRRIVSDGTFLYGLPQDERDEKEFLDFDEPVVRGLNEFDGFAVDYRSDAETPYSEKYESFTLCDISNAVSEDGQLRVRFRKPGDRLFYGGMNRRLKNLFNEKHFPQTIRDRIPVFYDGCGVVWVPGFRCRESGKDVRKEKNYLVVYWKKEFNGIG